MSAELCVVLLANEMWAFAEGYGITRVMLQRFTLPVRGSYMECCGALRAEYMQYIMCDRLVYLSENRKHSSEKRITKSHLYFVNDRKQ